MDAGRELAEEAMALVLENVLSGVDGVIGLLKVHVLGGIGDAGCAATGLGVVVVSCVLVGIGLPAIEQMDSTGGRPNAVFKYNIANFDGGENMRVFTLIHDVLPPLG
jgi:hypothetical protein